MELFNEFLSDLASLPPWVAFCAVVFATFVSEDLTCIAAGLLAASGEISIGFAMTGTGLGIFLGDLLLYGIGRFLGRPALRQRPLRWLLTDEDIERSEHWFALRGMAVIFLGRFIPGSRLPSYLAAGLLNVNFFRFAISALIAVAIWSPLLVGGAVLLGQGIRTYYQTYEIAVGVLVLAAVALLLALKIVVPLLSRRGRRIWVGHWRRMTRWEFWPPYVFYAPVLIYVLWLALRHRSLSLLTAVNPGIFAGGFVGESKFEILSRLDAPEHTVATHRLNESDGVDAQVEEIAGFVRRHDLDYPIILKPDRGQRGSGVHVIRSEEEARAYLARTRVATLVQEYAPGEEFGVFYYRYPSEPRGRIFSITRKILPHVVGDGVHTIEELILKDERAIALASLYLSANHTRLWDVPAPGQRIQLVELGNHCRGAIFRDGGDLMSSSLENAFDHLSKRFSGFFFGRYDVRAPSAEELRDGRGFKIIELNGATSEATHIYDERHSLRYAYGVLFEQWRILFAIAAENRAVGAKTVAWPHLLKLFEEYWLQARSHP